MKISNIKLFILVLCLCLTTNGHCNNKKLLPRFVATKSSEVNARTGPGIKYPIEWIFIKKGEPLEITAEFEQWRYVKDIKGEGGFYLENVLLLLGIKKSSNYKNQQILPVEWSLNYRRI